MCKTPKCANRDLRQAAWRHDNQTTRDEHLSTQLDDLEIPALWFVHKKQLAELVIHYTPLCAFFDAPSVL
jgi:hypothetical protein